MRLVAVLVALTALGFTAIPAAAQGDVELLSRLNGTPLPPGYAEWRAQHPDAFQFAHGRSARMRLQMQALQGSQPLLRSPLAVLGPRDGTVEGVYRIPVVLGLFSDSPADSVPVPVADFRETYFGSGPGTVKAYYTEVSGGRVTLDGDLLGWVRSNVTQAVAAGGKSGLFPPARVGDFIVGLLDQLPSVDWSLYDNDGPDGVPNSGDDDGYVDALAVVHPTNGPECSGSKTSNKIWSHKWSLAEATSTRSAYTTATPSANGGFLRIDDYFIQPAIACGDRGGINQIGVFTHEAGHAFGLPDLYDTRSSGHSGDGNWDLMATGAYGCNGRSPERPCHLGAWSKSVLGWVDVITIPTGTDLGSLTLPPVETSGKVVRMESGDGTGTFVLLENRERIGFDQNLVGTGLLVWQIDPTLLADRWAGNAVNASNQMAIWLRQADGRNDLGTYGGGRGDAGDPFPYADAASVNNVFHAGSNPASRSTSGSATGITVLDIQRLGTDVALQARTRFTQVSVLVDGAQSPAGLVAVDGVPVEGTAFASAPFAVRTLEAAAGESLGTGLRTPFVGWTDDASAPRMRTLETPMEDISFTAEYGGVQAQLGMALTGGINGVAPGTFVTEPVSDDLWFTRGATVSVQAVPQTGFAFLRWTGALDGQTNPAVVSLDDPVAAGADFELTYKVPSTALPILAGVEQDTTLEPENGTAPFYWYILDGEVAQGLSLDPAGRLTGTAVETGMFDIHVEVRDSLGLSAQGDLHLDVEAPAFSAERLGAPFLLNGAALTEGEKNFLDQQGNANGVYDLGDFRAWVLGHPDLPRSGAMRALLGTRP